MRILLLLLISCGMVSAADLPSCYINSLALRALKTTPPPIDSSNTLRVQVRDSLNIVPNPPTNSYQVAAYIDDPTMTSLTDFRTGSDTSSVVFDIPNAVWGTGTKNPRDGSPHTFYVKITNSVDFPAGVSCVAGNGWPYKYDTGNSTYDFTYAPYTSIAGVGASPGTLGIIFNPADPYSVGTTGTPVCTVGGTNVFPDGVAGAYVSTYGISCSHVHKITISAASGDITLTAMNTAYATLSPALTPAEQFLALAWTLPYRITAVPFTGTAGSGNGYQSVASYFAYGGVSTLSSSLFTGRVLRMAEGGTVNGMFRSTSITPLDDFGQRPTFHLGHGTCATTGGQWSPPCTASASIAITHITATKAANLTNPSGGKILLNITPTDANLSASTLVTSPLSDGIATRMGPAGLLINTTTTVSGNNPLNTTGILGFVGAAEKISTGSTGSWIPGVGWGWLQNSAGGSLNGTDESGQNNGGTPVMVMLNFGAAFSCGAIHEPYGLIPQHYPDPALVNSYYTNGGTAIEAAWHAMRDPVGSLCTGDPLSQPFSPPFPPAGIIFGVTLQAFLPWF